MKDERNFEISEGVVILTLSPALYSKNVVMRAAYRLLDRYAVRVLGDGISEIKVEIRTRDEGENVDESVVDAFFAELLQAEMEEQNLRRFGDVRKVLMELAIKGISNLSEEEKKRLEEVSRDETERSV